MSYPNGGFPPIIYCYSEDKKLKTTSLIKNTKNKVKLENITNIATKIKPLINLNIIKDSIEEINEFN